MRYFLVSVTILFFSALVRAEMVPSQIYVVEITGNSQLKKALLTKLTKKPCFKLADIQEGGTLEDCHAFVPNSDNAKLTSPNTYLFKIKLKSAKWSNQPRVISVQGFKNDGNQIIRYFNPGKFSIPSEHQMKSGIADFSESQFIEQASNTIVGLTFK